MQPAHFAERAKAPTVYLVERNGSQQEAICAKLRKHGYHVLVAANPERAVERFGQEPYEVLIVDVSRTGADGFRALWRVLNQARHEGVPCHTIAMLASDQQDVARAIRDDVTFRHQVTVLYRPVRLLELLAKVREVAPQASPPSPAEDARQPEMSHT